MGLLRKQQKQGQASDWVAPAQMLSQPGGPGGPPGPGGAPVPARLRALTPAGPVGDWLPGALHLSPGSIRWEPDQGASGQAVELATAMVIPPQGRTRDKVRGKAGFVTDVQTPVGMFQIDMDPVLFEMSQELVLGSG